MCTSTVAAADALPAQPEIVIGDSTVDRSGICTSVLLLATHSAGLGDDDGVGLGDGDGAGDGVGLGDGDGDGVGAGPAPRLMVQESMRPMSTAAASWSRSFQVAFAGSGGRAVVWVLAMLV